MAHTNEHGVPRDWSFNDESDGFRYTEEELRDSIGEDIDAWLQAHGKMFVWDGKGERYLVDVSVQFTPSPEN